MKRLLSISTLFIFLYIQLFNGMIWMKYEIYKSEIIQKFCENKDKPELKCEGSCHLKKMIISEDEEDEGEPAITIPQIQLYLNEVHLGFIENIVEFDANNSYSDLYYFEFSQLPEIPPKA